LADVGDSAGQGLEVLDQRGWAFWGADGSQLLKVTAEEGQLVLRAIHDSTVRFSLALRSAAGVWLYAAAVTPVPSDALKDRSKAIRAWRVEALPNARAAESQMSWDEIASLDLLLAARRGREFVELREHQPAERGG